jgi:hypothetical protein
MRPETSRTVNHDSIPFCCSKPTDSEREEVKMSAIVKFLVLRLGDASLIDISEAIDVELDRRMEFVDAAPVSVKRQPPAVQAVDVPEQPQRRKAA